MVLNSNFRYTAYVTIDDLEETYASNDPNAIIDILDEYGEMFGEENSVIGMIDNTTGEVHFLKTNREITGYSVTDIYKSEFFKEYFE